jgi:hypothetical protein
MKVNLKHVKKCDQIWEEMTPCEGGRICQKCTKVIVDFRPLSDQEVADIHTFSKEPVCGIYREDQLKIEKPTIRIKKYSKAKMKAIWLGLLGLIYTNDLSAMKTLSEHQKIHLDVNSALRSSNSKLSEQRDSIPKKEKIIIYGKLFDENNEPLIGGTIHVMDTRIGTDSDFDGYYRLDITESLDTTNQITLVYKYVGYNIYEKIFSKGDSLEINVSFEEPVTLDVVSTTIFGVAPAREPEPIKEVKKKSFLRRLKFLFRTREKHNLD